MDLALRIPLVVSIALTVFALGLQVSTEDVLSLPRRPAQLLRSLLAMNVIMPVAAVALAATFDLHPAVKIALVGLALSPVPPVLPGRQLRAGGSSRYVVGLLAAAGLFAVVFVPLALEVIGRVFTVPVHLSPWHVAKIVLITVLAPLAVGMIVSRVTPAFAERIASPLSRAAKVLLVAALVPVLVTAWPAMVSLIGNGTLAAFTAFIVIGLAAGHLLGGPDPADRTVLALSTASRHPGVALTIAVANFPEQKLVLPALLLYLIAGAVLSIPYSRWRRHMAGPS
jgi:BASS family bile acid:Na+ symporter